MKKTEFVIRLWVSMSCEEIIFCYQVVDSKHGTQNVFTRCYKSTPKRVAWVVFASNKYTHYKG